MPFMPELSSDIGKSSVAVMSDDVAVFVHVNSPVNEPAISQGHPNRSLLSVYLFELFVKANWLNTNVDYVMILGQR